MMVNPPPSPQRPPLEIPEGLEPVYANLVRISHLPSEFVIDFALRLPGAEPAKVMAQVLMSPLNAKLFLRALADNLGKYEAVFGEIQIPGQQSLQDYSRLFRPPQTPDRNE